MIRGSVEFIHRYRKGATHSQCKQIDTGSKHGLFWVAHARGNLFAQNNDKARELGILSYFDIYDLSP